MDANKRNFNASASIVLYNNDVDELKLAINSLLSTPSLNKIYLIDNSGSDLLQFLTQLNPDRVNYKFLNRNIGFGAAHNVAIQMAIENHMEFHFVVNPDVYFEGDVVGNMLRYLQDHPEIGMMMPQVLNKDGSIQNLPKLLPSPYSVLMRKFKRPKSIYDSFIRNYELREVSKELIYEAPILSGCFTALNLAAIKEVGGYDDKFFMYFEDWDLSRRVNQKYRTIYYPLVSVYHGYEGGANKNSRLFKIFLQSMASYFNKWGWFFDKDRSRINQQTLMQFKK